jgi:hypothetical protein
MVMFFTAVAVDSSRRLSPRCDVAIASAKCDGHRWGTVTGLPGRPHRYLEATWLDRIHSAIHGTNEPVKVEGTESLVADWRKMFCVMRTAGRRDEVLSRRRGGDAGRLENRGAIALAVHAAGGRGSMR